MDINTNELSDFIKTVTKSISQTKIDLRTEKEKEIYDDDENDTTTGMHNYYKLNSSLDFEISVIVQKIGKGKINLLVADIGADYKKESLSKIKFTIDSVKNIRDQRHSHFLDRFVSSR